MDRPTPRQILALLHKSSTVVVGQVSWVPPGWLGHTGRWIARAGRWTFRHRVVTLGIVTLVASLTLGGVWFQRWYASRPKPVLTHGAVTIPALTPIEHNARPRPLIIEFDRSAAPLEQIGKVVTQGCSLSPAIEGTWRWASDQRLVFTPNRDWPVGRALTIHLARQGLLAETIKLERYELELTTRPFGVTVDSLRFYQDPQNPGTKKVVATLRFTHPVDVLSLQRHIGLRWLAPGQGAHPFNLSYDRLRGHAYLHSAPITIREQDQTMELTIESGVRAGSGGPGTDTTRTSQLRIPARYNHLKLNQMQLAIVTADNFQLSQILVLNTSLAVPTAQMRAHLSAHLLPLHHPDRRGRRSTTPDDWSDPALIGPEILKRSRRLALTPAPSSGPEGTVHGFHVSAPVGRYLLVQVTRGLRSASDFVLARTEDRILRVPDYPSMVKIVHPGAILALGGEHKVAVFARDVPGLRFEIGRVLPGQLHTLVSQTEPTFTAPGFWRGIGPDHLTELFTEEHALPPSAPGTGRYEALDLSRYLAGQHQGLFLLKVQRHDPVHKTVGEPSDHRLVLVTDLGLVVKDQQDGSHAVFVQSLRSGAPVTGARVQILGRNGLPLVQNTTDATGRASLPSVARRERTETPTLYVVRHGNDMAMLPYGRHARYLNLSRFDVGGVTDDDLPDGLSAYLFSDRGLYRPGDEIRVGVVVKSRDWKRDLTGVPLEATVTDPRGVVIRRHKLRPGRAGFEELRHVTSDSALTGRYTFSLRLVQDGQGAGLLGSTSVRVREFLPDRMKIHASLSARAPRGWIHPDKLSASITLHNLFGTAAAGRRVRATLYLSPAHVSFPGFPEHSFHDWLDTRRSLTDELPEATTDGEGRASFDLRLGRFAAGTHRLRLVAQGFESRGGRSVVAETGAIVSPLPYLVGYKPDGELRYINRGSRRTVELVALGPDGKPRAVKHLTLALIEHQHVSVLTRQPDGTYRYESMLRERELRKRTLSIGLRPRTVPLSTARPGDFVLVLRNDRGADLCRVPYSVAGEANVERSMERNAELQLTLDKSDVEPGQMLQLQIRAPFTGAGLITVERDRVHAHRWFRSRTTSSVQQIRVPATLEGNAYVTVTYLRDPSSPEVLISPLSHGVAPFTISRKQRTTAITLTTPPRARPGQPFTIRYRTDRKARLVIFAVDEGILRVARYQQPAPLDHFLAKRALQVRTAQILDLVLPEFAQLTSAPGGGDDSDEATRPTRSTLGANLNPFSRRRDPPVAFWSGILPSGPDERQVTYPLPDHFNGTLRVMAVAVAPDSVGATQHTALVRGDFVISPNLPLFAVPRDEFTLSVAVANTLEARREARVELALETSAHLERIGPHAATLTIPHLGEATARFRLRATDELGPAQVTLTARDSSTGARTRRVVSLDVRPATPHLTTIEIGRLEAGRSATVVVPRQLFPHHRTLEAGISALPLGLAHGLIRYLEHFPHGCTEQVVSQAMPAMVLSQRVEFGLDGVRARHSMERVLDLLRARQNDEGAFGLWAANSHISEFATVYAVHFLIEARQRGFDVPPDLLRRGLGWIQRLVTTAGDSLADERLRAYGLYLLARDGRVVGARAAMLHKRLDRRFPRAWRTDLCGVYLAATYQLLHQDRLARDLIEASVFGGPSTADLAHYHDVQIHDAQLLQVLARHFPGYARRVSGPGITHLVQAIRLGRYNTLSSAYIILALEAYATAAGAQDARLSASQLLGDSTRSHLPLPEGLFPRVGFSPAARELTFTSAGRFGGFYAVVQSGFDRRPRTQPIRRGLELFREYTDASGKPVTSVRLGDEIEARIRLRSLTREPQPQLAIVDMFPAGFEPMEMQGHVAGSSWTPEHQDAREDRLVLYGMASTTVSEFRYALKATSVGRFTVPAVKAESMYDREVVASSRASMITVAEPCRGGGCK